MIKTIQFSCAAGEPKRQREYKKFNTARKVAKFVLHIDSRKHMGMLSKIV